MTRSCLALALTSTLALACSQKSDDGGKKPVKRSVAVKLEPAAKALPPPPPLVEGPERFEGESYRAPGGHAAVTWPRLVGGWAVEAPVDAGTRRMLTFVRTHDGKRISTVQLFFNPPVPTPVTSEQAARAQARGVMEKVAGLKAGEEGTRKVPAGDVYMMAFDNQGNVLLLGAIARDGVVINVVAMAPPADLPSVKALMTPLLEQIQIRR